MMDFLNTNTIVLFNRYQLMEFNLFDSIEFMVVLYYFKDSGDFF